MSRTKVERPLGKLRAGEYASVGDQLDAIWKLLDVILPQLSRDIDLPQDALDVLDQVMAVKARFPKG